MVNVPVVPFLRQRMSAITEGVKMVYKLLENPSFHKTFPEGFTTHSLYNVISKVPPPPNFKPYPLRHRVGQHAFETKGVERPKIVLPMPPRPEHPEHPVRSTRFLKVYILPELQNAGVIKMSRFERRKALQENSTLLSKKERKIFEQTKFEWKWTYIPPEQQQVPQPPRRRTDRVVGREVGVGLDISHLNRRRRDSRVEKINRETNKMKEHMAFLNKNQ